MYVFWMVGLFVLALVVYVIVARRLGGGQRNRVLPSAPQVIGRDRLFATSRNLPR